MAMVWEKLGGKNSIPTCIPVGTCRAICFPVNLTGVFFFFGLCILRQPDSVVGLLRTFSPKRHSPCLSARAQLARVPCRVSEFVCVCVRQCVCAYVCVCVRPRVYL